MLLVLFCNVCKSVCIITLMTCVRTRSELAAISGITTGRHQQNATGQLEGLLFYIWQNSAPMNLPRAFVGIITPLAAVLLITVRP